MRLAHVVLAHTAPAHLARLADRLLAGDHDDAVLVHVDAGSDLDPFLAALDGREDDPRFTLLPRFRCAWGGFGMVEGALAGIDAALALNPAPDQVNLLSGQDYPIRPRAAVVAFLGDAEARSYLRWKRFPAPGFVDGEGMDRLERYYVRPSRRWSLPNRFMPFVPRRRLPEGLAPYGGRQFWSLDRETARYVRDFVRERPDVPRFFRHSFVSDETFFQMVVLNGPRAAHVVNRTLHFAEGDAGTAHARVLDERDLPRMRESDALFARKFAPDTPVLDAIDAELLGLRS